MEFVEDFDDGWLHGNEFYNGFSYIKLKLMWSINKSFISGWNEFYY